MIAYLFYACLAMLALEASTVLVGMVAQVVDVSEKPWIIVPCLAVAGIFAGAIGFAFLWAVS